MLKRRLNINIKFKLLRLIQKMFFHWVDYAMRVLFEVCVLIEEKLKNDVIREHLHTERAFCLATTAAHLCSLNGGAGSQRQNDITIATAAPNLPRTSSVTV